MRCGCLRAGRKRTRPGHHQRVGGIFICRRRICTTTPGHGARRSDGRTTIRRMTRLLKCAIVRRDGRHGRRIAPIVRKDATEDVGFVLF